MQHHISNERFFIFVTEAVLFLKRKRCLLFHLKDKFETNRVLNQIIGQAFVQGKYLYKPQFTEFFSCFGVTSYFIGCQGHHNFIHC